MKAITMEMIRQYNIKKLGFDFAGYIYSKKQASFHHLIVPKRNGGKETMQNGAVLMRDTIHDYIHRIEMIDYDIYRYITSQMIEENVKGYLDPDNMKKIDDVLTYFEREHCSDRTRKGHPLIKEEYIRKRVKF